MLKGSDLVFFFHQPTVECVGKEDIPEQTAVKAEVETSGCVSARFPTFKVPLHSCAACQPQAISGYQQLQV